MALSLNFELTFLDTELPTLIIVTASILWNTVHSLEHI